MASPVKSGDIEALNLANSICAEELKHLRLRDQMKEFLDWMLDSDGNLSDAFLENFADKMTPIGSILLWSSSTLPSTKYLLCNGQAVSRTTYASLFARIGVVFGSGDGSTTFNLPNLTDRVPVGIGSQYTMAQQVGAKEVELSEANLPAHTHTIPTKRVDSIQIFSSAQVKLEVFKVFNDGSVTEYTDGGLETGSPATAQAETDENTSSTPTSVSVMQPSLGVQFIIKAL